MSNLKVLTAPLVRLATAQYVDAAELDSFFSEVGVSDWRSDALAPEGQHPTDAIPEIAGRLCYMSYDRRRPGGNKAYIQNILESQHGSVVEHAILGFIIAGVSRTLTHELIRHRAGWAYSELSQRFVDCSDVAFVCPPALLPGKVAVDQDTPSPLWGAYAAWHDHCLEARNIYRDLSEDLASSAPSELSATDRRKWARQAARSVLPGCTETRIFATANVRAIRHFLEMRGSRHADAEVRNLANAILTCSRAMAPNLFADYTVTPLPDGTQEIVGAYRKV